MNPEKIDGLLSMTQSARDDHLGYALDLLYECHITRLESGAPPGLSHRRVAMSCIIHAFSSLESALSRLSYEMFSDVESRRYVPEEQRGFALHKLLATWARMSVIDKFDILLERGSGERPSAKLLARLRELNNLRNWLVHGFPYKRTLLL